MYKIKEARILRNISQKELANQLGIAQTTVSVWENNKKRPSIDTIIKISNILNVSVDYLLGVSDSVDLLAPCKNNSGTIFKIKEAREMRGISQKMLAIRLGIGQSTVSGWENDNKHPSVDMMIKISDALNVSINFLLGIDMINSMETDNSFHKKILFENTSPSEKTIDDELISMLVSLSPSEVQRVQDFVSGILSSHRNDE